MRRTRALLALALAGAATLHAEDAQVVAMATQLKGQAEALHAAAQPPEDGPKPPRIRNWMLRKEIQNLGGLAEQMAILGQRERSGKLLMRTHLVNLQLTTKRIKFGIFSGAARHLEGVRPAFEPCVATVKALHTHLWAQPGQGPVEGAPPAPPPPEPPTEDPGDADPAPPEDPGDEDPAPPEDPGDEDPAPPEDPGGEDPAPPEDPGGEDPAPPEDPGGEDPTSPEDPGAQEPEAPAVG